MLTAVCYDFKARILNNKPPLPQNSYISLYKWSWFPRKWSIYARDNWYEWRVVHHWYPVLKLIRDSRAHVSRWMVVLSWRSKVKVTSSDVTGHSKHSSSTLSAPVNEKPMIRVRLKAQLLIFRNSTKMWSYTTTVITKWPFEKFCVDFDFLYERTGPWYTSSYIQHSLLYILLCSLLFIELLCYC